VIIELQGAWNTIEGVLNVLYVLDNYAASVGTYKRGCVGVHGAKDRAIAMNIYLAPYFR